MKLYIKLFALLLLPLIAANCKKNTETLPPPAPVVEVPFGTQTEAQVRATLIGKWKWHYTYNSFIGQNIYFNNRILEITPTDSIYRWDDGVQVINSKINYEYGVAYYPTYLIYIINTSNKMHNRQFAYAKKGDTLILEQPVSEVQRHFLTKM